MGVFDKAIALIDGSTGSGMLLGSSKKKSQSMADFESKEKPLIDFLGVGEGYKSEPYQDTGGVLTVGLGHKVKKGEDFTGGVSKSQATGIMKDDLEPFIRAYDKMVEIPLSDNQRIAVISLIYNNGADAVARSDAMKALNQGDFAEFKKQAFSKDHGFVKDQNPKTGKLEFVKGLYNRRQLELELFNK